MRAFKIFELNFDSSLYLILRIGGSRLIIKNKLTMQSKSVDVTKAIGYVYEPYSVSFNNKEAILYALSIGFS